MNTAEYLFGHRNAPPSPGLVVLGEDFGEGEGPMPEPPSDWILPTVDELLQAVAEMDQAIALQDDARYIQRDANPDFAYTEFGEASRITAIARERIRPKVGGAQPEPPPPEPPPPARILSVYGTYSGHGLAVDAYPGRTEDEQAWGPHHDIPIVAPVDGRVEVYQLGTPLGTADAEPEPRYTAQWHALADGWTCLATPQQTMYVAVFYPSQPLTIHGQSIGHLHYGHVRSDIKAGPVRQGEQFATVWDSGIRFEPGVPNARAAHVHCCAGAGTQLSPNGDLTGLLAVLAQGWTPTSVGTVPGPQEYSAGGWTAGRRTSDFTREGRPIPPMPS